MENREAIEMLERFQNPEPWEPKITDRAYEALQMAISALEKQEQERWRRYPEEKPNGQEIILATMPAYTDRNGDKHLYGGVICAYHTDSYRGG